MSDGLTLSEHGMGCSYPPHGAPTGSCNRTRTRGGVDSCVARWHP